MVLTLSAPRIIPDTELITREGTFFDEEHYSHILREDADVFAEDTGTLLFSVRRRVLTPAESALGLCFEAVAKKTKTENRRIASGQKIVSSYIAGYYDTPTREIGAKPCRLTAFTRDHVAEWRQGVQFIEAVDRVYQQLLPERHAEQRALVVPDFLIGNTIFSTVTVNYNFRTACHVDSGDIGYSALTVVERGQWSGCHLGYPGYKVALELRQGDVVIMNPHEYHCNTEFAKVTPDAMRLSFVLYLRDGLRFCPSRKLTS